MENIPDNVSHLEGGSEQNNRDRRKGNVQKNKRAPRKSLLIIFIILLIGLAAGGAWYWQNQQNASSYIDSGKYQALFLSNGQVYFGKLVKLDGDYFKLTDIYYLQTSAANSSTSQNPQNSANSSDVKLIKLGSEVHGPEDQMIVSKEQVLFFENLKADGKVTQSINQFQSKK